MDKNKKDKKTKNENLINQEVKSEEDKKNEENIKEDTLVHLSIDFENDQTDDSYVEKKEGNLLDINVKLETDKEKMDKIKKKLNKKCYFKVSELIVIFVLVFGIAIMMTILGISLINKISGSKVKNSSKNDKYITEFQEVYDMINESYYKDTDKEKMIDSAINGMLSSLDDPHTSYFSVSETENFNELMNGSYEGIGAEISIDKDNKIFVASVFKGSPADEVGLKSGDYILSVNDKSTEGLTTTEVVAIIKDVKRETAKLNIKRNDEEKVFEIKKRVVVIESVESEIIEKNNKKVGYVIINNFANNTYEQFRKQIEELEKKNTQGLVIDVRGNSGGYLHSVTSMLDMILPKGKVIYQIGEKKKITKYKSTSSESRNYPIAVLINKASASASEILAVSLKESYGAYVVGTSSYGKGTVQVTKDLDSGAMIKYTVQKWLSPKGNWINDIGVEPTDIIELAQEYTNNPTKENDNQLQKALDLVSKK